MTWSWIGRRADGEERSDYIPSAAYLRYAGLGIGALWRNRTFLGWVSDVRVVVGRFDAGRT